MTDLDELRRRSEWARWYEAYAAAPWWWRARWWIRNRAIVLAVGYVRRGWFLAIVAWVTARERLRDAVMRVLRRPLFIRCANYCRPWSPCRGDATHTLAGEHAPTWCAECAGPLSDEALPLVRVGRWYRVPYWVTDEAEAMRVYGPEKATEERETSPWR